MNNVIDIQELYSSLISSFTGLLDQFLAAIPMLLGALLILLVGYIVASDLLSKAIYWIVFLAFLTAALEKLGMKQINDMIQQLISIIPNILVAGIIMLIGGFLAKFISDLVRGTMTASDTPHASLIARIAYIIIMIFISMMALAQVGIDVSLFTNNLTVLITGIIAAVSLATGLGAKGIMKDIIAAQMLRDRYEAGDTLEIQGYFGDDKPLKGVVVKHTMTGTIVNMDGKKTHIAASDILESAYTITK